MGVEVDMDVRMGFAAGAARMRGKDLRDARRIQRPNGCLEQHTLACRRLLRTTGGRFHDGSPKGGSWQGGAMPFPGTPQ